MVDRSGHAVPFGSISFDHTTAAQRVIFGAGQALDEVVRVTTSESIARVLLIASSSAADLADEIAASAPVVARVTGVTQHVPLAEVRGAVDRARTSRADAVIAVGGGSAVGLAKAIVREIDIPIIAIPTTFAGSEATDMWGITEDGHKRTGTDRKVLPRTIIYDASLTLSLPDRLAVSSGLNAIAHAVDSLWAPRADPINLALGREGLSALVAGLDALVLGADPLAARETILYGAYLAATAFASAGAGLHHKICHVLGGAYGLPHAETHAVVLPYVVAFNTPHSPGAAAALEAEFGTEPGEGLRRFSAHLGVASSLQSLGLAETDLDRASELILSEVPPTNPRPVTRDDLRRLLERAWAGQSTTTE
ncbi:maleylacetate reductase [Microbacterium sp. NPDC097977]|uniref:maleylacetate reductase n=1 Tax=Microbacterium sp. NPDC097977 TaxID=3155686 RepID=UPI00332F8CC4